MKTKITADLVKTLQPAGKPYEVRDDTLSGFLLRVQPAGTMTFYIEYRLRCGVDADGKTVWNRNRVKLGKYPALTAPKAREKARASLASVALGEDLAAEKRETPQALTLRGFITGPYREWAEANLRSAHSVMNRLQNNFPGLLDKPLTDLTPFDFEANRIKRLKGVEGRKQPKPATVNRDLATMRAALARAVAWNMLPDNPMARVKKAKEDRNTSIRAITDKEEVALLAVLDTYPAGWYFKPLIITLLDSGMRRGEALSLEWNAVDFEARLITISGDKSKSYQSRRIPMTARCIRTLKAWRVQVPGEGLVFPGANGTTVQKQWEAARATAGINGLRLHDLRHSYASRLAHAGAGVLMIKNLLGHSSITTSQRYMHAVESDLRRAVDLLEAANVIALKKGSRDAKKA